MFSPQRTSVLLMLTQKHQHQHHSRSYMGGGGGGASFKPFFNLTFFLFLITLVLIGPWIVAYAESNDTRETPPQSPNLVGGIAIGKPPPPPSPLAPPPPAKPSAFKPGMAVVVGVLTTMFSLTFLLLLYIKHCNNGGNVDSGENVGGYASSRGVQPLTGRKNSGIDRSVVESLPIFRFRSLMGQKDGLDCAVCLTKFEAPEILRLLPKCKHAFHVECVDTWLDAHSTCPLCRYRVDPEDILLVEDTKILRQNQPTPSLSQSQHNNNKQEYVDIESGRNSSQTQPRNQEAAEIRRVSGRHSSVGDRDGGCGDESEREQNRRTASFRRSLDSATATPRRKEESVGIGVGCFVRPRKDGMLLTQDTDRERDRTSAERRLEHRIIVSPSPKYHRVGGLHQNQRWSDVQPSDLLYLTSEMIIGERRGFSSSLSRQSMQWNTRELHERQRSGNETEGSWNGRGIVNSRSVSEITGLSRFSGNDNRRNREGEGRHHGHRHHQQQRHREEGVVSR